MDVQESLANKITKERYRKILIKIIEGLSEKDSLSCDTSDYVAILKAIKEPYLLDNDLPL